MTAVTVRVPAKVNLQLGVGPLRPDGYHGLVTVFHAVSLFDEVTAEPAGRLSVQVTGDSQAEVPVGEDNLAARAARALAERAGVDPAVRLTIHKRIPVAGGMAGGSADAAAALVACDALWGAGLGRGALLEIAAELGADVPFALVGGTAVGMGKGEHLTPVLGRGEFQWVFALGEGGLSTTAVYREFDRLAGADVPPPRIADELMAALRSGDPVALGRTLTNDLQPAALSLRPSLRLTLEAGLDQGALGAIVSGSGPTCAFLARTAEHALDIAVGLSAAGVCKGIRRAVGPAPGARVVAD